MKIHGIQGRTAEDVRNEVQRGGRFVVYPWAVSLLVVSLRRSSAVHYLAPGQGGFLPNFLWSLLTCVAGWWGIPWGPIFTVQALWRNLRGGVDVTADFVRDLPTAGGSPLPGASHFSPAPLVAAGLVAFAATAGVLGTAFVTGRTVPAALVNGLGSPYTVVIDGQLRRLEPGCVVRMSLPAAPVTVSARLPGGEGETRFEIDAGRARTSLFNRVVAVVNPDAAALVLREFSQYHDPSLPDRDAPPPVLEGGRQAYVLPAPDFFLIPFPDSVQVKGRDAYATKSRITVIEGTTPGRVAEILGEHRSRTAMADYLVAVGRLLPDDEQVLSAATALLKPDEIERFFASHLDSRPVKVEWHRFYQEYMTRRRPDLDLRARYAALAAGDPDDGALAYLHARVVADPAEALALHERALRAARPCAHGHLGVAWARMGRAEFEAALASLETAAERGVTSTAVQANRMECLESLGRYADLRREVAGRAMEDPSNAALALTEVRYALLDKGPGEARAVIDRFVGRLPAAFRQADTNGVLPADALRFALEAHLDYYEGEVGALARRRTGMGPPAGPLIAAICGGDLPAAEKELADSPVPPPSSTWLILYLEAFRKQDPGAPRYWESALRMLTEEGARHSGLLALVEGAGGATPEQLRDLPVFRAEKRILLAALLTRETDPARATALRSIVRSLNTDPSFPRHLVSAVAAEPAR